MELEQTRCVGYNILLFIMVNLKKGLEDQKTQLKNISKEIRYFLLNTHLKCLLRANH